MNPTFFTLSSSHELAYNHIVKPHRRWAFSYYFLHRWLPLLNPQQAMLVQVLRQSSWQNGRPTGGCQLTNATLCGYLGWSDSSHKTLLAELERPYSDWFVMRERTRKRHVTEGHGVEGAPRYRVQMDDPLTPRDQNAMVAWLSRHRPATPYAAAELLATLAQQRTRDLWEQLDGTEATPTGANRPATVAALAVSAWSHLPATQLTSHKAFMECAEQLQVRLTGVGYSHLELDYLLRGWLPTLGINNTWLIIALRARCFYDPQNGETRDVAVVSRRDLERQLNIPERTFRRVLRDDATLPLFHIAPVGEAVDAAAPRTIPHRGDLAFHVAYPLLPIAPYDRAAYEQLLLGDGAVLSTSGQSTHLISDNQPISPAALIHKRQANPSDSGQATPLSGTQAASQPVSKRSKNPSQSQESGQTTHLNADKQPDIPTSLKAQEATTPKEQTTQPSFGKGEGKTEKAEIRKMLEPFAIQGIASILQNTSLTATEVQGWILRAQQEVEKGQIGGYLFRRLRVNSDLTTDDPLPLRYQQAGAVNPTEQGVFEGWWLEELAPPPFADEAQRERYGAWLQVVKSEEGNPDRPDYAPKARFRRELARS